MTARQPALTGKVPKLDRWVTLSAYKRPVDKMGLFLIVTKGGVAYELN